MTLSEKTAAAEEVRPTGHGGIALALICIAQLMVVLDATIANIALPYIQDDLDISQTSLSWVITGYSLTFGGFLLLGGRTGDLFGRRRAFIGGLTLFALASALGGIAQNEAMLLGSRALQGLGAAFASPNALALITTTFEPGPRRSRAFSVYAMMSGLGAAVGLVLGGWLTGMHPEWFAHHISGWRFTFLINVPIGVGAALLAPRVLAESDRHAGELDVPGAVTATTGLLSLVYGITRAGDQSYGWTDTWTVVALAVGVTLLAVFAGIERSAQHPMLPFRILRNRNRMAAYGVMMLVPAAMFTTFYFLTLLMQNVLGDSPIEAGLHFLPFSITMIITAIVVSKLVQRVNPGILNAIGCLIGSAALFGLSRIPYHDTAVAVMSAKSTTDVVPVSYWSDIFPFVVLLPVGMACVFIPATMSVVHRISPRDSGIASGVLNTMQQVGGALGLATLATIAVSFATDKSRELCGGVVSAGAHCNPAHPGPLDGLIQGVSFAHGGARGFLVGAGMLLVGALIAGGLNRIRHQDLATSEDMVAAP